MPNVFDLVCEQKGWPVIDGAAVVSLPGGRQQQLVPEVYDDDGQRLLRVYSVVGDAKNLVEIQLRAALGINSRLLYGALAIMDDQLVMTDTFLMDHADPQQVSASVTYMAKTADRYESLIYKTDLN